jgi:hypothetical protein
VSPRVSDERCLVCDGVGDLSYSENHRIGCSYGDMLESLSDSRDELKAVRAALAASQERVAALEELLLSAHGSMAQLGSEEIVYEGRRAIVVDVESIDACNDSMTAIESYRAALTPGDEHGS